MTSILFVLPEFGDNVAGGIASYYKALFPKLLDKGISVSVCVPSSVDSPLIVRDTRLVLVAVSREHHARASEYVKQFSPFLDTTRRLTSAYAAYFACLEAGKFDLVETVDFALLFVPWLAADRSLPTVVQLHGSSGQVDFFDRLKGEEVDGVLARMLESTFLSRAEALWSSSRLNAADWAKLLGRDVDYMLPACALPADATPNDYSSAGNVERAMVVGRLQRWKGPEYLCQALRLVQPGRIFVEWFGSDHLDGNSTKPMSVMLAGSYPDQWGYSLSWRGQVSKDSLTETRRSVPFLVCPSSWDTLNLAVLEGMSVGQVPLVSQGAGVSEFLVHGESGFLVPADEPEMLAAGLENLLSLTPNSRKRIGNAAFDVARRLTALEIIDARIEAYERVAARINARPPHPWISSLFGAARGDQEWDVTRGLSTRKLISLVGDRIGRMLS